MSKLNYPHFVCKSITLQLVIIITLNFRIWSNTIPLLTISNVSQTALSPTNILYSHYLSHMLSWNCCNTTCCHIYIYIYIYIYISYVLTFNSFIVVFHHNYKISPPYVAFNIIFTINCTCFQTQSKCAHYN